MLISVSLSESIPFAMRVCFQIRLKTSIIIMSLEFCYLKLSLTFSEFILVFITGLLFRPLRMEKELCIRVCFCSFIYFFVHVPQIIIGMGRLIYIYIYI